MTDAGPRTDGSERCVTEGPSAHLAELSIRDFAIVDQIRIEWTDGFIALTGETGAGKSIIIDALGAAMGDRFDPTWLRAGAERAAVEAIFWGVASDGPIAAGLAEVGCEVEDDQVVLTRDVQSSRSVARVNGRTVPLSVVQELASRLVDVHSQASHLSLSRVSQHLAILDRFGRAGELRTAMASATSAIRGLRREIERLQNSDRQAQRESVLLRHEVEEIDAAGTHGGEEDELIAQRSRLRNTLRLRQLAVATHDALEGGDEGAGALELLSEAVARADEIRSLDGTFDGETDRLVDALDAAEELSRTVRRYADSLEEDPEALATIEERMLLLADLKRKYGSTLADVLSYRETAARRLQELEHSEERIQGLRQQELETRRAAAATAVSLSALRASAARELDALVQSEMVALGMSSGVFCVAVSRRRDAEGLEIEGEDEPVAFDETGVDRVEFLMSANAGEPPRPLVQIASGGELARFMLALKSALSAVDETPVLIFDELDQGIGGRMGHVLGEKLWRLSREHQVVCITHLPQVAAYADAHYAVGKVVEGGRTVTRVERLTEEGRVAEITQMLGGSAAGSAMEHTARELLDAAARWKAEA